MIKEILKDIYRIKIPLPGFPLIKTNSYIIRSEERSLIIDPGFDHAESEAVMHSAFGELDLDPDNFDIFVTHLHVDHAGLVGSIIKENTSVYLNGPEARMLDGWKGFEPLVALARKYGLPKVDLTDVLDRIQGRGFYPTWGKNVKIIESRDILKVGGYVLRCLATPGHSVGHTCLYEQNTKVLFSGDHILSGIPPCIQCWSDDANPLLHYMGSLRVTASMDISMVLPGHFGIVRTHRRRIEQLIEHHQKRLRQVMGVVSSDSATAYEIASRIQWNPAMKSWEDLQILEQWVATLETLVYLRYLEERGKTKRETHGDTVAYRLTGASVGDRPHAIPEECRARHKGRRGGLM